VAPQDSQNCGRDFAKGKQSDVEFAGNGLLRIVIIDIESNNSLDGLTLDPAGMHCPSWDDAFVSSYCCYCCVFLEQINVLRRRRHEHDVKNGSIIR